MLMVGGSAAGLAAALALARTGHYVTVLERQPGALYSGADLPRPPQSTGMATKHRLER